jgi:hypothetical protein
MGVSTRDEYRAIFGDLHAEMVSSGETSGA